MKTFVHIKSGNRYPQHGCICWFHEGGWGNKKVDKDGKPIWEHHIKPGYEQCTNGWKRMKMNQWRQEDIPDLVEPYTDEQWKEYAKTYGTNVAQEFLKCCDYSKPSVAYRMFNPSANEDLWQEYSVWFKGVFGVNIWPFADGMMLSYGNTYSLDVLRFEKYLERNHGYRPQDEGSMNDFMVGKFGQQTVDAFRKLFFGKA